MQNFVKLIISELKVCKYLHTFYFLYLNHNKNFRGQKFVTMITKTDSHLEAFKKSPCVKSLNHVCQI